MHLFSSTLNVVAWLVALAWLYKLLEAAQGLRTVPHLLAPEYDADPAGNPTLTVIVPARNEAQDIAGCLESLLRQDYPNLRIIAVDDRSTDETGAIMETLVRAHSDQLELIRITELPSGWLGKTHAMARAARAAIELHQPDYVLFTDGDIFFRPDAIRRALAQAVVTQADHFVLLPTTLVKTRGEGMLLSFLQVISMWAVRIWRVADPAAKRDALGVGAFNMIRTSVFQQIGGFDVAALEILEDLDLGKRVKSAGYRQRVATGPGMVNVHWATGALGIVTGMTKNLFAVFRFRIELLLGAAAWMVVFCIAPVFFLAHNGTRVAGVLTLASAAGLYGLSSRTSRISPFYMLTLPIAAAVVAYSMLRSMVITVLRGGVTWRGTFYPLKELRRHGDGSPHSRHG
jgi:cellulose synthase/poly-beta-1,6-N-acetylglucosamine synthase-like glycosyltransferase